MRTAGSIVRSTLLSTLCDKEQRAEHFERIWCLLQYNQRESRIAGPHARTSLGCRCEQVFLAVFAGEPGPTPESLLPNVREPILALRGDSDPWTPVDSGAHPGTLISRYHDNFTLEVVSNTGHCPHDERPDLVNARMLEFLRK